MGTPTAAISLIDRDRQWFLASVGLDISETPRACSFCAHAMLHPNDLLCVPDASRDERFRGNPLVTAENGLRFYAGAPLILRDGTRSEEHTSELQSLMRISYAVLCLKKKNKRQSQQADKTRHN